MEKNAKIYVSGHSGLVGNAVCKILKTQGYENIITRSHKDLDLLSQSQTDEFFKKEKPDYVIHLAGKVGGIRGNKTYPADYIYENLTINSNVIFSSHKHKVKKLLNLGSVCIYPVLAPIPIKEEYLLTGPLEYTNEGYALAKIASLMMCKKYFEQYGDNFISVMPANLYGPFDNFDPLNGHVIPMLMGRIHKAKLNGDKEVTIWGTGKPTRDFLYSEDVADALIFIMNNYNEKEHLNISTSVETSIKDLVEQLVKVIGYTGNISYDTSKPDGTPKRYLDTTKVNSIGWKAKVSLNEGLNKTYKWFLENEKYINDKYHIW